MRSDLLLRRDSCPACGATKETRSLLLVPYRDERMLPTIFKRYEGSLEAEDLSDASFELVECVRCDQVFQRLVPTDAFEHKVYTYAAHRIPISKTKRTEAPLSYHMEHARRVERMAILLGGRPHEHAVLDFGMGWGYFLGMARAYGHEVCGVEISEERVAFAREKGIPCVPDLEALAGRTFSFIHSDQTFEHLSDPFSLLTKFHPLLADDGFLFLAVPNGNGAAARIRQEGERTPLFRKLTNPLEHVNCFSHRSLVALAERAGFSLVGAWDLASTWLRPVRISQNADLLQAAARTLLRYGSGTELYFCKRP